MNRLSKEQRETNNEKRTLLWNKKANLLEIYRLKNLPKFKKLQAIKNLEKKILNLEAVLLVSEDKNNILAKIKYYQTLLFVCFQ